MWSKSAMQAKSCHVRVVAGGTAGLLPDRSRAEPAAPAGVVAHVLRPGQVHGGFEIGWQQRVPPLGGGAFGELRRGPGAEIGRASCRERVGVRGGGGSRARKRTSGE